MRTRVNLGHANAVPATATVRGGEILVSVANRMTLNIDYTKGTETSLDIYLKFLDESGGDEVQQGAWSATAGVLSFTATKMRMTASGKYYADVDVKGKIYAKIYVLGNGSVSGTYDLSYVLS